MHILLIVNKTNFLTTCLCGHLILLVYSRVSPVIIVSPDQPGRRETQTKWHLLILSFIQRTRGVHTVKTIPPTYPCLLSSTEQIFYISQYIIIYLVITLCIIYLVVTLCKRGSQCNGKGHQLGSSHLGFNPCVSHNLWKTKIYSHQSHVSKH